LAIAAAYADVSARTLRRYISHGRLTGYRVGPRLVKVDLNELEALARPIPPTGETPFSRDRLWRLVAAGDRPADQAVRQRIT
jgi:excisionase family DNA binding protein